MKLTDEVRAKNSPRMTAMALAALASVVLSLILLLAVPVAVWQFGFSG